MFAGQAAIDKVERTKLPCNRISVQNVGKMKRLWEMILREYQNEYTWEIF